MFNRARLSAVAAAVTLLMSSCLLSIKGFTVSSPLIAPGGKVVVSLHLFPTQKARPREHPTKAVPFIVVAQSASAPQMVLPATGRIFDTRSNYGRSPRPLFKDQAMRDVLVNGAFCEDFPVLSDPEATKVLVRTQSQITIRNKVEKVALSTIPMKLLKGTDTGDATSLHWAMVAGMWLDNREEGTRYEADSQDTFICTSTIQSNQAMSGNM